MFTFVGAAVAVASFGWAADRQAGFGLERDGGRSVRLIRLLVRSVSREAGGESKRSECSVWCIYRISVRTVQIRVCHGLGPR